MFSSTSALKADQDFVAFTAAFGCRRIKRHLCLPFAWLRSFFFQGTGSSSPRSLCVREEITAGGKKIKIWISLWIFFLCLLNGCSN